MTISTVQIAGWLLFSVMSDGTISTANFPTEALCNDGASIVMYGMTVEEKKHDDMVSEAQSLVNKAFWERDHPPTYRGPKNEDEQDAIKKAKQKNQEIFIGGACGMTCINYYAIPDGRIKEADEGEIVTNSLNYNNPPRYATHTRCFPVPAQ